MTALFLYLVAVRMIFDPKNRQKTLDFTGKNRKNFLKLILQK